eukprot:3870653-Alexandrium_andersonii.AAC.1
MYEQPDPKAERTCIRCRKKVFWRKALVHHLPVQWTQEEWDALGTIREKEIRAFCRADKGNNLIPKYAYSCKDCTVE